MKKKREIKTQPFNGRRHPSKPVRLQVASRNRDMPRPLRVCPAPSTTDARACPSTATGARLAVAVHLHLEQQHQLQVRHGKAARPREHLHGCRRQSPEARLIPPWNPAPQRPSANARRRRVGRSYTPPPLAGRPRSGLGLPSSVDERVLERRPVGVRKGEDGCRPSGVGVLAPQWSR